MTQTITFAAISLSDALTHIKSVALTTIKNAIKDGIGGQDYCWYTDSCGQVWVVKLGDMSDRIGSMVCWKKPSLTTISKAWQPEKKSLMRTFSVEELCRFADQCVQKDIKCFEAQLWVNGKLEQTALYENRTLAEEGFKATVDVKAYDKVEVKVEPVMASIVECVAFRTYLREQKLLCKLSL